MKGEDKILSDFLSRQTYDDSDPHDIILIAFNMHKTVYEKLLQDWNKRKIFSADTIAD